MENKKDNILETYIKYVPEFKDLRVLEGKSKKFMGGINDDIRIIN